VEIGIDISPGCVTRSQAVSTEHGQVTEHPFLRLEVAPNEPHRLTWVDGDGRRNEMETPSARLTVNSDEAMKIALRAGAGIGTLGIDSAAEDLKAGRRVRLLPDVRVDPQDVLVLYASRRYLDAKIRTFITFIKGVFEQESADRAPWKSGASNGRFRLDDGHRVAPLAQASLGVVT
jgi:DNA-binding transcriptional LysR family regulator